MQIDVVHRFVVDGLEAEFSKLRTIIYRLQERIMATQAELAATLTAVQAHLTKASAEIQGRVAALEEAIANAGNSTPEVDAALEAVKAIAQALDDLNPDPPAA